MSAVRSARRTSRARGPSGRCETLLERGYSACEIDFGGGLWMDRTFAEDFGERAAAIGAVVEQLEELGRRLEPKGRLVPFGVEVMGRVRELGALADVVAMEGPETDPAPLATAI
jgi:hypothetical protein